MAHRKNKVVFKVDSSEVQGEGSFVVFSRPTWDKMKDMADDKRSAREAGIEVVSRCIVDWDWVDDDDQPLPKPVEDPTVINRLPQEELMFLLHSLGLHTGGENDLKN